MKLQSLYMQEPPNKPSKDIPAKPDKNPDPTAPRPGGNEPGKNDPTRIQEPGKMNPDPTRIDNPPPTKPSPSPQTA
jgi:hypothetical protein